MDKKKRAIVLGQSEQIKLLKAFLKWRLDKPHSDFQTQDYDIKEFLKTMEVLNYG